MGMAAFLLFHSGITANTPNLDQCGMQTVRGGRIRLDLNCQLLWGGPRGSDKDVRCKSDANMHASRAMHVHSVHIMRAHVKAHVQ